MDISGREIIDCPLNKNCLWKFKYNSEFQNYNLPVYECQDCKLQTIHPKENIDWSKVYTEEYYSGKAEYSYKDERKTERFDAYVWKARIRNIQKYVKSGNFLDVGCSFGGFLNSARELGFSPYGVEISPYSAEHTRKRDIPVFVGSFLESDYPENFFDVITMVEVIEHLENPKLVMKKLFKLLKPGGMVLLQTANFEGKQAISQGSKYHYYLPGHIFYYSRSNLDSMMKMAGFSRSVMYYGVDFPLSAKLLKSRGSFKKLSDYKKWLTISYYHLKSTFWKGSTSSMVMYFFKDSI